jgi:hypothetical protein
MFFFKHNEAFFQTQLRSHLNLDVYVPVRPARGFSVYTDLPPVKWAGFSFLFSKGATAGYGFLFYFCQLFSDY